MFTERTNIETLAVHKKVNLLIRTFFEERFETVVIMANSFDKVNYNEIINDFGGKESYFLEIYKSAYVDGSDRKLQDIRILANYAYCFTNAIYKYKAENNQIPKKYIPIAVSSLHMILKYPIFGVSSFLVADEMYQTLNLLKILIADEIPTPFKKDFWTYNVFAANLEFVYFNKIASDSSIRTDLKEKILKIFPEDKEKLHSIQLLFELKYENN